jgi:hypothetical protein
MAVAFSSEIAFKVLQHQGFIRINHGRPFTDATQISNTIKAMV